MQKLRASFLQGGAINNFAQRLFQNFANSLSTTNYAHRSSPLFFSGKYYDSEANGMQSHELKASDCSSGIWDPGNSTYTAWGTFSNRNAVRATVKCECDLFFAHVFGTSISTVEAESISAFNVSQDSDGDTVFSLPYVVN